MEPKLTKLKSKLSYSELTQKMNALEAQYEEVLGARETWDENLKNCFGQIRMTALCKQFPEIENLECQYESRNSREMD
mgnify:CR=1 FL=1